MGMGSSKLWWIAGCLPLLGCSLGGVAPERQWLTDVGQLGYLGLYPISEDLQPGDVLLEVQSDDDSRPALTTQRLGTLGANRIGKVLRDYDETRLRIEPRPDPTAPAPPRPLTATTATATATARGAASLSVTTNLLPPGSVPLPPASPPTTRDAPPPPRRAPFQVLRMDNHPNLVAATENIDLPRMRRTALPLVASATVSTASLNAAGPIGQFVAGLGLSFARNEQMYIRLAELEQLGMDSIAALQLLDQERIAWLRAQGADATRLLRLTTLAQPSFGERLCLGRPQPRSDRQAAIHVVQNVLYAHSIEYEFANRRAVGARGAAELALATAARNAAPAAPVSVAPAAASGGFPTNAAAAEAQALAALAAAQAAAANQPRAAGGTLSLATGRFGGGTAGGKSAAHGGGLHPDPEFLGARQPSDARRE